MACSSPVSLSPSSTHHPSSLICTARVARGWAKFVLLRHYWSLARQQTTHGLKDREPASFENPCLSPRRHGRLQSTFGKRGA